MLCHFQIKMAPGILILTVFVLSWLLGNLINSKWKDQYTPKVTLSKRISMHRLILCDRISVHFAWFLGNEKWLLCRITWIGSVYTLHDSLDRRSIYCKIPWIGSVYMLQDFLDRISLHFTGFLGQDKCTLRRIPWIGSAYTLTDSLERISVHFEWFLG